MNPSRSFLFAVTSFVPMHIRVSKCVLVVFALVPLVGVGPVGAQVTGVSYTFSPVGERVLFEEDAGLSDGYLYGGTLGFGFGEYVELSGLYQLGSAFETEFAGLGGIEEGTRAAFADLLPREVGLQRYGGEIKFNLGTGSTTPYVTLGTGILRFDPDGLDDTRTIYLTGGAGVQLSQGGRYTVTAGVENISYRYDLATALLSVQDRRDVGIDSYERLVNNWAMRAGLQVYLGGRSRGELTELDLALRDQLAGGVRGLGLIVEPSYSTVRFDEVFAMRDRQRMAGIAVGLDMGPYVGLRGFYWRGIEEGEMSFDDLQAYGGELKLAFGSEVRGITPYVTIGGGYLDVLGGYVGSDLGVQVEDHPFALGGGGLAVPIGNMFRLHGDVRTLLMASEDVESIEQQSDVYTSWMYSLGVTFSFGRRAETPGRVMESRFEETEARAEEARTREERLAEQLARSEARIEALTEALLRAQRGDSLRVTETLTRLQAEQELRRRGEDVDIQPEIAEEHAAATRRPAEPDPRMVTLPVLEEGEVYVRFGDGGGRSPFMPPADTARTAAAQPAQGRLTANQIEQIVRETVRDQLQAVDGQQAADVREERLQRRIERLEDRISALADRREQQVVVRETEERAAPAVELVDQRLADMPQQSVLLAGVLPFSAISLGEPAQFALGARADLRSASFTPMRVMPEFALGLGLGNYSYHINVNAVYPIPTGVPYFASIRPYVGGGLGFLGFDDAPADVPGVQLTINVLLGGEIVTENGVFFAEYGNFDFFSYNRFAVGYRYGF